MSVVEAHPVALWTMTALTVVATLYVLNRPRPR